SHPALPPFPTRRSSDLTEAAARNAALASITNWSTLARQIVEAERSRIERAAAAIAAPLTTEPDPSGRLGTLWRDVWQDARHGIRSEEHTSELQSLTNLL